MTNSRFLKYVLLLFTVVSVFYACKSKDNSDARNIQLLTDSTAYKNNMRSDTASGAGVVKGERTTNVVHTHSSTTHHSSGNTSSNSHNTSASSSNGTNTSSGSNTSNSSTSSQKKGWSKGAQGAVIGGAAGAVGGAIISKHKGTGAAIGAVVGATGGYIIGHNKDKKDGRIK